MKRRQILVVLSGTIVCGIAFRRTSAATPKPPAIRLAERESYELWIHNQQKAARILLEATGSEVPKDFDQEVEREAKSHLEKNGIRVRPRVPIFTT